MHPRKGGVKHLMTVPKPEKVEVEIVKKDIPKDAATVDSRNVEPPIGVESSNVNADISARTNMQGR